MNDKNFESLHLKAESNNYLNWIELCIGVLFVLVGCFYLYCFFITAGELYFLLVIVAGGLGGGVVMTTKAFITIKEDVRSD